MIAVITSMGPYVLVGKTWTVVEVVMKAQSRSKHKKIVGVVQQDCRRLEWSKSMWWLRRDERN